MDDEPTTAYQTVLKAIREGNIGKVQSYIDKDGDSSVFKQLLMEAAYHGKDDIVKLLLGKGAYVNSTDYSGQTPLYRAAVGGNVSTVNLLIERGAEYTSNLNDLRDYDRKEILDIIKKEFASRDKTDSQADVLDEEVGIRLYRLSDVYRNMSRKDKITTARLVQFQMEAHGIPTNRLSEYNLDAFISDVTKDRDTNLLDYSEDEQNAYLY